MFAAIDKRTLRLGGAALLVAAIFTAVLVATVAAADTAVVFVSSCSESCSWSLGESFVCS
jgi:hypothetical protein